VLVDARAHGDVPERANAMMLTTHRFLTALTLTSMIGCASASARLTVDGQPAEFDDATGQLTSETDRDVVQIRLVDHGPANVADAGIAYQFRLELAPSLIAGTSLTVAGDAVLGGSDTGGTRFETSFAPGAAHDARVLGVYTTTECFCGSGLTHFEQHVTGTIDVVEVRATAIVVSVDLAIDGTIPGGAATRRFHLVGSFEASRPTR
jgi:hypothetical protein